MVASAGAALIIGCGGGGRGNGGGGPIVTGNLVPPPSIQVCIVPTPQDATVALDGAVSETGCTTAWDGDRVSYEVSAEGYTTAEGTVSTMEAAGGFPVTLEPATDEGEEPDEEPAQE